MEGQRVGDTDAAATVIENAVISAKTIQRSLIGWLRFRPNVIAMGNVYVLGSPWECDVISVSSSYYFNEFEVKLTIGDLQADFSKRLNSFNPDSLKKHDAYASRDAIIIGSETIPKPRKFSFVVPRGLVDTAKIPEHCGLIEYDPAIRGWNLNVVCESPVLRCPTKLDQAQVFNLAVKAASRFNWE